VPAKVFRVLSEEAQKDAQQNYYRRKLQNNNPAFAGEKKPFNPFGHPCGLVSFIFFTRLLS
jgi:hypothetical protein